MSLFNFHNIGVYGNTDDMVISFVDSLATDPENIFAFTDHNLFASNVCRFATSKHNSSVYLYARTKEINEVNESIPFNLPCAIIIDDGTKEDDGKGKLTVESWKSFIREKDVFKDVVFLVVKNTQDATPGDIDQDGILKVCIEKRVNTKLALRILREMLITKYYCSVKRR